MKDSAKLVFNMLGFQYKPLEKLLLKQLSHSPKATRIYKNSPYSKKIMFLDRYASVLGF